MVVAAVVMLILGLGLLRLEVMLIRAKFTGAAYRCLWHQVAGCMYIFMNAWHFSYLKVAPVNFTLIGGFQVSPVNGGSFGVRH